VNHPNVTADSLTDEQIREERRSGRVSDMEAYTAIDYHGGFSVVRYESRAGIAAAINARAKAGAR